MELLLVCLLTLAVHTTSTETSQKYLQDTIKDLRMKTHGRNVAVSNRQPSLNTLTLRRIYSPPSGPTAFAQSHAALSADVDKMMDNVAAMISAASEDTETVRAPPTPQPRPPQSAHAPSQATSSNGVPVPALHLTKAELATLYANAVRKGETIKLEGGGDDGSSGAPLTAAVHELDASGATAKRKRPSDNNGYYYYYYPLKSFMDELTSAPSGLTLSPNSSAAVAAEPSSKSTRKSEQFQGAQSYKVPAYHPPPYHHHHDPYFHAHTHQHSQSQHNVHIAPHPPHVVTEDKKKAGLEPLFMAISGFVGMTVMFILSILVLPKFKKIKPKGLRRQGRPDDEELHGIARVALQAIDGYDCTERFACEAGKAANAFGVYNNRFVRLLRNFGPFTLAKQINRIGKYTDKKYRCAAIRCKQRGDARRTQASSHPPLTGALRHEKVHPITL